MNSATTLGLILICSTAFYFLYLCISVFTSKAKVFMWINIGIKKLIILLLLEVFLYFYLLLTYTPPPPDIAGGFLWENLYAYPKGIFPYTIEKIYFVINEGSIISHILIPLNALAVDYILLFLLTLVRRLVPK